MNDFWIWVNLLSICLVSLPAAYLWTIALAAIKRIQRPKPAVNLNRFAIALPAHNEESVIATTVATLQKQKYPPDCFDIFVVADNCSDRTAGLARQEGATCFERFTAERSGKGAALRWLFERIFEYGEYDAIVVFDADTQVSANFLQVMNDCLENGARVIQGRHVISNPQAGWFPALTWAMMTIDCRLFSQGRANLGFSARHMGDSICFRTQVLKNNGWGGGLTEDYEFRLQLLLAGICIQYEPHAIGYGQAPVTWQEAQAQRLRWARGVADASRGFRLELFKQGIRRMEWRLIDGALSITLPSYSTLALVSALMLALNLLFAPHDLAWPILAWSGVLIALFLYPWFGLALEKAPGWAYLAILAGPWFMLWRTWINLLARLRAKKVTWVRTPHRG
jgi:cellulose synthase/poly-beta-1,6-N-acetylglucosamine synthase-like glycosyltransferase